MFLSSLLSCSSFIFIFIFYSITSRLLTFPKSYFNSYKYNFFLLILAYHFCIATLAERGVIQLVSGFSSKYSQLSSSGSLHIMTTINVGTCFLTYFFINRFYSISISSPFANCTMNLFTKIYSFFLSSVLVEQKKNK